MQTERGGDDRFVLEQDARALFEVRVALRILEKDRDTPAVLRRLDLLVIPGSTFDEADGETRAARPAPIEQVPQIALGISQVSLDDNARMRPVTKFRLGEERPEKFERGIFVRVTFHVGVTERAQ